MSDKCHWCSGIGTSIDELFCSTRCAKLFDKASEPVDVHEYNRSLLREPSRDKLRATITSQNMRRRVLAATNGHAPLVATTERTSDE